MKKSVLFFVIAGLTAMSAFGQKKETRSVSGFTGIDASCVFDITVTKGSTESLTIEADEELLPYVRSEVKNGVLCLCVENDACKNARNIRTLKASVVVKNLDRVSLSGACKLTANDLFTPDSFTGKCSGASNMTVNVNTGRLKIETSGAGKIQLKADVTENAQLSFSGSANAQMELKAGNVKIESSGSSSFDLAGSTKDFNVKTSGASKIKAEDFTAKNAKINSSGSSNVTIAVTDALNVSSSGSSSVSYKGTPTVKISSSGSSKIISN